MTLAGFHHPITWVRAHDKPSIFFAKKIGMIHVIFGFQKHLYSSFFFSYLYWRAKQQKKLILKWS